MIPTKWDKGRAVFELEDGTVVSILTPERTEWIMEAAKSSPSYLMGQWTLVGAECDDETYEVSFRTRTKNDPEWTVSNNRYVPFGWKQYQKDDDGDWIYAYVPREVVHEYLEAHGGKEVDE